MLRELIITILQLFNSHLSSTKARVAGTTVYYSQRGIRYESLFAAWVYRLLPPRCFYSGLRHHIPTIYSPLALAFHRPSADEIDSFIAPSYSLYQIAPKYRLTWYSLRFGQRFPVFFPCFYRTRHHNVKTVTFIFKRHMFQSRRKVLYSMSAIITVCYFRLRIKFKLFRRAWYRQDVIYFVAASSGMLPRYIYHCRHI